MTKGGTAFSLGDQFHRRAFSTQVLGFLDTFDGGRLLVANSELLECLIWNEHVWNHWQACFPLALLQRNGNLQCANRRLFWAKWARSSELLNRHLYYRALGLHNSMTFYSLMRGSLQCEQEQNALTARSAMLAQFVQFKRLGNGCERLQTKQLP